MKKQPTTPQTTDLCTRAATMRAATANDEARTIEAVIATENPVRVFDWVDGEYVDEILLMRGLDTPARVPLLDSHSRWSVDDVIGSTRDFQIKNGELHARNYFAADARAHSVYERYRDGHLTDFSVGYRVGATMRIERGQSAVIDGVTFTAPADRALRVATQWSLRENSAVPIGADAAAKARSIDAAQMPEQPTDASGEATANNTEWFVLPELPGLSL